MLTQSNKTSEGGKQNQPLSLRKKIIRTFKTFEAGKQKDLLIPEEEKNLHCRQKYSYRLAM